MRSGPALLGRCLLLASPLAVGALVPAAALPVVLAYAVTGGGWLIAAGALATAVSLAARTPAGPRLQPWRPLERLVERPRPGAWRAGLLALLLAAGLVLIPGHRWGATRFSGDEPKYVRMAVSLHADLDVDVASRSLAPPTAERWQRNLRWLALATRDALRELISADDGVAADHRWSLGNWAVAGRHGGRYYVQSPGLPILMLPAMVAQDVLAPDRPHTLFPQLLLLGLWAVAATEAALLAASVSGSRLAGLLAALAIAFSAPLFLASHHFYPEVAAAAGILWALRRLRPASERLGPIGLAGVALAIGGLPWLHVKFTAVSAALALLLAWRLRARPRRAVLALAIAAVPFLLLLLFDHHVTGLFRPDALYRRYGSDVYPGLGVFVSLGFLKGLATALFGARDGLFVMAPAALAGALALPLLWRRSPRDALWLGLVFAALWAAAAAHRGGAPGPPGRLLAPVAGLFAAPLAVGLCELRTRLAYRWTVAALVLVGGLITWTMLDDWRRTVNPYREMFASDAVDFSRLLPDGPRSLETTTETVRHLSDVGRGLLLASAIAFWTGRFTGRTGLREPLAPRTAWRAIRDLHLAWWGTLAVLALGLAALTP